MSDTENDLNPASGDSTVPASFAGVVDGDQNENLDDLIDVNYLDDPEGDRVDNNDAILSNPGSNDDLIKAGEGNDTVFAGEGNDEVRGGNGDDLIYGESGDDTLLGEAGNDTLIGGSGSNLLQGYEGDDLLVSGDGADTLMGGDDSDTFTNLNAGDVVSGGQGGVDYDTLDLTGSIGNTPGAVRFELQDTVTDNDGNGIDGSVVYFDADDNEVGQIDFTNIENIVPCFTPGTLIATPQGERRVEDLKAGDRVITRDNGIQEIRWLGQRHLNAEALRNSPHMHPVLIKAGALGNSLPERDMLVSPNHRVLVANDKTTLYFEEREVLVAAKHLVDGKGIVQVEASSLTYIHFMFDQHEVVLSDGAWTESFQPGDYTLKGIGKAQSAEIFELFPELEHAKGRSEYTAARRTLKKHEARLLLA